MNRIVDNHNQMESWDQWRFTPLAYSHMSQWYNDFAPTDNDNFIQS